MLSLATIPVGLVCVSIEYDIGRNSHLPCDDQRLKQLALAVYRHNVTAQAPEFVCTVEKIEIRREISDIFNPFDQNEPAGKEHLVERRLQGLMNLRQHPFRLGRRLARGGGHGPRDFVE